MKKRIKNDYQDASCTNALLYFAFYFFNDYPLFHITFDTRGTRTFRLFEVNKELDQAEILLKKSEHEKAIMEAKIKSLSSDSLSADKLDELGRQELGFIKSDEYVIFE